MAAEVKIVVDWNEQLRISYISIFGNQNKNIEVPPISVKWWKRRAKK